MSVSQIRREPNEGAVEALEELLEEARSGNLQDFVLVANLANTGQYLRSSHFTDRWRMLGAIEYAKATIERSE